MKKSYNILALDGDGIGPEIIKETKKILSITGEKYGFEINWKHGHIGGSAIDKFSNPLPDETIKLAKASDSVILGAVGGPKWDELPGDERPERGLLGIRASLGLFANYRPARIYNALKSASPLKDEILSGGLDIMIVRELTGGIYFGKRGRSVGKDGTVAFDTEEYSELEIRRIAKCGFESAMKRSKNLCSVDKANVLESSRLWREVVIQTSKEYPEVELSHMYVDNAAMQLVRDPKQFDVIVTSNIFGDILSDEASQITGSIGMLPSASLSGGTLGLYEPVHGSAPDIAGKNIANPLACILSGAMMLEYSLGEIEAAKAIEKAVEAVLDDGLRSADIISGDDQKLLSTTEMGNEVSKRIA